MGAWHLFNRTSPDTGLGRQPRVTPPKWGIVGPHSLTGICSSNRYFSLLASAKHPFGFPHLYSVCPVLRMENTHVPFARAKLCSGHVNTNPCIPPPCTSVPDAWRTEDHDHDIGLSISVTAFPQRR